MNVYCSMLLAGAGHAGAESCTLHAPDSTNAMAVHTVADVTKAQVAEPHLKECPVRTCILRLQAACADNTATMILPTLRRTYGSGGAYE
jgi:hypothetical protein